MRIKYVIKSFLVVFVISLFSLNLCAQDASNDDMAAFDESGISSNRDAGRSVAIWDKAAVWIWTQQRIFHRELTRELRELRGQDRFGWTLVLMSFLYGVFHAAGPGHGKAVLTTYLLTQKQRLYRGVVMGAAAALLQGFTALVLVYGLIEFAGWLPQETESASLWAARVSFALIVVVGTYLLARSLVSTRGAIRQLWLEDRNGYNHHHHDDDPGAGCGCKHVPSVAETEQARSSRAALGVILAVGLRPCSGAILVLIFAALFDLAFHGALAVLAMSVGTAITIVVLAVLSIKAREWASTLVAHRSPYWGLAGAGVGVLGGCLLLLIGMVLLGESFDVRAI